MHVCSEWLQRGGRPKRIDSGVKNCQGFKDINRSFSIPTFNFYFSLISFILIGRPFLMNQKGLIVDGGLVVIDTE